jgi:hypothetical protein
VLVVQDAHPEPSVARIPLLSASVHWRALIHGRLVGDFLIDHPVLNLNLAQAKEEIADPTPVKGARLAGCGGGDLPAQDQPLSSATG